jgi:protein-tyrosine-phosphatase
LSRLACVVAELQIGLISAPLRDSAFSLSIDNFVHELTPRYNLFMPTPAKFRVLFVCLGNACRSPMAEAIARKLVSDIIEPSSAGLHPFGCLAGHTKETLLTNGYSVAGLSSKPLRRASVESADVVINMSGQPLDSLFPGAVSLTQKVKNWNIEDPYGAPPATYQKILEELESRVLLLAARLRSGRQRATNA